MVIAINDVLFLMSLVVIWVGGVALGFALGSLYNKSERNIMRRL